MEVHCDAQVRCEIVPGGTRTRNKGISSQRVFAEDESEQLTWLGKFIQLSEYLMGVKLVFCLNNSCD